MIIGVTGSLATGTSTAAKNIALSLGCPVISADKLARKQLTKGSPVYSKIINVFGKNILSKSNAIDRIKLAGRVFKERKSLKKLCDIVHPFVVSEILDKEESLIKKGIFKVVVDGPLLIESKFYKKCDYLVVVTASLPLQLKRARKYKGIKSKDALSRICLQMPLHKKLQYADFIIDNNDTLKKLKQKCLSVAEKLK